MSFTIGRVDNSPKNSYSRDYVDISIVDEGIQVYAGSMGMARITPAQAKELGRILINAADRWTELNERIAQIEAEREAMEKGIVARIKDVLR